jgi:heme/copper-type cytochrome/quinol oxidase subunit 2
MNVAEQVDTNSKSTVIIAATVSVVLLLCIAYCMRVLYRRMNADELEQTAIKIK